MCVLVITDNFIASYQMPGKPLNVKSNDFSFAKGLGKYLFWNHEYQGYQTGQKMSMQSHLAFPVMSNIGIEDFFFHMLIKWLYLFWEFPGLSMAVTDLFHKLIYFFMVSAGTCVFIPVGFFFVVVAFPFLPISHLKNLFLAHLKVARIVREFWCSKILIHILSC